MENLVHSIDEFPFAKSFVDSPGIVHVNNVPIFILEEIIVSGSSDSTVRVWDLKTLQCKAVLDEFNDSVKCLQLKVCVSVCFTLFSISRFCSHFLIGVL